MHEKYSINEILNAVDDLQGLKKEKVKPKNTLDTINPKSKLDIPTNTLKLIEEAEKTIKSK